MDGVVRGVFEDGCGDDLGDECHDVEFGVGGLVVVDDLLVDDAASLPALGLLEWDVCVACGLGEGVGRAFWGSGGVKTPAMWCPSSVRRWSTAAPKGACPMRAMRMLGCSCRLVGRG